MSFTTDKELIIGDTKTNSLITSSFNILQLLGVPVTYSTLKEKLLLHPNFPSVAAIEDTFVELRVGALSFQIEPEDLPEVEFPMLAMVSGDLVMVTALNNQSIEYLNPRSGWITEGLDLFQNKWNGIVLMIGADQESGEKEYKQKKKAERLEKYKQPIIFSIFSILLIIALLLGVNQFEQFMTWFPTFLLKIGGLSVCAVLLIYQIDRDNPFVQKVCEKKGQKTDCNSVLESSAAKLFGLINLSEIGAFYFIGSFLMLLFGFFNPMIEPTLSLLAIFNIIALPYTFFSIYYQGIILKKWCPLCLITQVILWLEFVALFQYLSFDLNSISTNLIAQFSYAYLFPLVVWLLVKPHLGLKKQVHSLNQKLARFKKDTKLFDAVLQQEAPVILGKMPSELTLGNSEAPVTLTIVSNPFCTPCGKAHHELKELQSLFPEQVKLVYRFAGLDSPNRIEIVSHLLQVNLQYGSEKFQQALENWYKEGKQNKAKWKNNFTIDSEMHKNEVDQILQAHQNWVNSLSIESTPSIFINDRLMPKFYEIEDLILYLNSME